MSGNSSASGARSCGGSVRLGTASGGGGGGGAHDLVLDALYDRKRDKKTVRVLTVIIYVFCVSLAAIMLSLYYVFFWEPKDAHYAQRKVSHTVDQQTSTTPMPTCFMPHTGGSNISVSEEPPTPDNVTAPEPPDPPPASPPYPTEGPPGPGTTATDDIGTSTANETDVT